MEVGRHPLNGILRDGGVIRIGPSVFGRAMEYVRNFLWGGNFSVAGLGATTRIVSKVSLPVIFTIF